VPGKVFLDPPQLPVSDTVVFLHTVAGFKVGVQIESSFVPGRVFLDPPQSPVSGTVKFLHTVAGFTVGVQLVSLLTPTTSQFPAQPSFLLSVLPKQISSGEGQAGMHMT
jgi:hypothetical protein